MLKYRLPMGAILLVLAASPAWTARFNIRDYGATPGDATDDTVAITKALAACESAGGGEVFVPAGVYRVSRQASESPILELPSNCVLLGEGAASTIQFDPKVNQSNYWRMIGAEKKDCRNIVIRDLHLDGSNTYKSYDKGKTPEHNHGIFFHRNEGIVENVTIRDCLIENFSGDCIGFSRGCRNITIRDVSLRNFVRQGIQLGGGDGARDYVVSGCQDLEPTIDPGGSTIHVEHARGLTGVILQGNRCRHSLVASEVDGFVLRDNLITGILMGNGNKNAVIEGNVIRGADRAGFLVQLGFCDGLVLKDNLVLGQHAEAAGIYVWGTSRYNPAPSQNLLIADNVVRSCQKGIVLNGCKQGTVRGNRIAVADEKLRVVTQRAEDVDIQK